MKGYDQVRPGGTRGGCMIRFARNQTLYLYQNLICAFNTALARKGLAVFNRSAHSAWPAVGNGQLAMKQKQ